MYIHKYIYIYIYIYVLLPPQYRHAVLDRRAPSSLARSTHVKLTLNFFLVDLQCSTFNLCYMSNVSSILDYNNLVNILTCGNVYVIKHTS